MVPPARWAVLTAAVLLTACTSEARFGSQQTGDPQAARQLLAAQVAGGPLPVEIRNPPQGITEARIERVAAQGIRGLTVPTVVATSGQAGRRLVLSFDGPTVAGAACRPAGSVRPERQPPPTLLAVYCSDELPVAAVDGTATAADARSVERLVWQATGRLFPDDWGQNYGLRNLFGGGSDASGPGASNGM